MTFQHLNFDQLSDLLDDEIADEVKKSFLQHIAACELCRLEYESLCRCVNLLSEAGRECIILPDMCGKTIELYSIRKRRRFLYRTLPAIAASVIVITGASFIGNEFLSVNNSTQMVETAMPENDTQRIISSIRDADGRIIRMTGSYIESAIHKNDLPRLENFLKMNNLKYSLVSSAGYASAMQKSTKNIEDVDYMQGQQPGTAKITIPPGNNGSDKNSAIVRIFR
jgi:hypothetical protein